MNRSIRALIPSLTLVIAVAAPAAGGPRERSETFAYQPTSGTQVQEYLTVQVDPSPEARPVPGEKAVSVVVEDESGRAVAAAVHQGDAELAEICGATKEPVRLVSKKPVHVHLLAGPGCTDASVPTKGTITFTFTN